MNDKDCDNCAHHSDGGCSVWECSFTPKEDDTISRQASCVYCHEGSDGYITPLEKNGHAFIRFGMNGWEISLSAKGWNSSAKIMYCPMCGRDLKVGRNE